MRPWYCSLWRLVTHPYEYYEEKLREDKIHPATLAFGLAYLLTVLGWLLVARGRHTFPGFLWNLVLPIVTYPVAVCLIYLVCRLLVRETRLRSFFILWGFTYLPTFLFFSINIFAHALVNFYPWLGTVTVSSIVIYVLWSLLFLLFLWKFLLFTITLRLAGNLNLRQIIIATILLMIAAGVYWGAAIYFDWMKVPYI